MEKFKYVRLDDSYTESIWKIEEMCFKDPWSVVSIRSELDNENAFYIGVTDVEKNILIGYAGFRIIIDEIEVMRRSKFVTNEKRRKIRKNRHKSNNK